MGQTRRPAEEEQIQTDEGERKVSILKRTRKVAKGK